MHTEPENLTPIFLRRLDEKIDRMDRRLGELTTPINEVYSAVPARRRDQVGDAETVAHEQSRMDRLAEEGDRINRRLDLTPAD